MPGRQGALCGHPGSVYRGVGGGPGPVPWDQGGPSPVRDTLPCPLPPSRAAGTSLPLGCCPYPGPTARVSGDTELPAGLSGEPASRQAGLHCRDGDVGALGLQSRRGTGKVGRGSQGPSRGGRPSGWAGAAESRAENVPLPTPPRPGHPALAQGWAPPAVPPPGRRGRGKWGEPRGPRRARGDPAPRPQSRAPGLHTQTSLPRSSEGTAPPHFQRPQHGHAVGLMPVGVSCPRLQPPNLSPSQPSLHALLPPQQHLTSSSWGLPLPGCPVVSQASGAKFPLPPGSSQAAGNCLGSF